MQSRRTFLSRSFALGCTAAASPFVTPVTFASAPGEARLVVIVLRGAMDGLDVVRPLGDPMFARHRPTLDPTGSHDLNGFFALHPALDELMPLWQAGELGFAHAVSTHIAINAAILTGRISLKQAAWMLAMTVG